MKIVKYNRGASVVVQNQPNPGFFYIVKSGTLVIDTEHQLSDKHLSRFEVGDSFGMVSGLTRHNFLVTVYAKTDAEILQIPISQIGEYLKTNRDLAMRIMGLYVRELKALQKHLSKANPPVDRQSGIAGLLANAEVYHEWGNNELAGHALYRFFEYINKEGKNGELERYREEAEALRKQIGNTYKPLEWPKKMLNVPADTILFLEHESGEQVYVIAKGRVKLFSIVRRQEYILDVLDEGEIFGEMSMLEHTPRMGSATTEIDSVIMRLDPEDLVDDVGAAVLQKVFESLARRIWFSHQRLIILKIENPVTRLYALLYNMIRDKAIKKKIPVADTYASPQTLQTNFENLKRMSGILRIKDDTIKPFLEDNNIEMEKQEITVHSRKRLEEKLVFYKTRAGQIGADLL